MSKLDGHWAITKRAVSEIAAACSSHPLGANIERADLPMKVVSRDLLDVILLGHWGDYGQSRHFMRRFDGQSLLEAYEEGVAWIYGNAMRAVSTLVPRLHGAFARYLRSGWTRPSEPGASCSLDVVAGGTAAMPAGRRVFGVLERSSEVPYLGFAPLWWVELGYAIHALQDSFSQGHVIRGPAVNGWPGDIRHIKVYGGGEKEGHSTFDRSWRIGRGDDLTESGLHAVAATRSLIELVLRSGIRVVSSKGPVRIQDWEGFRARWLAPDAELSRVRNGASSFIEDFQVGPSLGGASITFSMDERRLAGALVGRTQADPRLVVEVFALLASRYQTDADDVAVLYVERIRARPDESPTRAALRSNPELVRLLIEILTAGYTGRDEEAAIAFLRQL